MGKQKPRRCWFVVAARLSLPGGPMIFGPELLPKVLSGEKTVTRRRTSRYNVGGIYAVQLGQGKCHVAHIKVLSVREEPLLTVTRRGESEREGFSNYGYFFGCWRELHGSVDYQEIVTRIEFELAPSCPRCEAP
jgi:hypothetical protein